MTWYILSGEAGAVQFMVLHIKPLNQYWPIDLGVHSKKPLYENQDHLENCAVLEGECYYSPSFGMAKEFWQRVENSSQPIDSIWLELESVYTTIFH